MSTDLVGELSVAVSTCGAPDTAAPAGTMTFVTCAPLLVGTAGGGDLTTGDGRIKR